MSNVPEDPTTTIPDATELDSEQLGQVSGGLRGSLSGYIEQDQASVNESDLKLK